MIRYGAGDIVGLVAAVPASVITNADCPDPEAAEAAAKMTGVRERRWVRAGQSSRSLCADAARRLLSRLDWDPASVDVLLYVTQTPEGAVPADVYRIAADLGVPAHCACLQVNWSCAGYVNGLWAAMRLLQRGQRALLLVGDATSTICDPGDRATAPLFGDAGSATAIVGGGPEQHFVIGSDGAGADRLTQGAGPWLRMDGAAVFNFTLKRVPPLIDAVLAFGDPHYVLLHQANGFMLSHLARKANVTSPMPSNIERFGNCSCASIPMLMATEIGGALVGGPTTRLAMLGFGAGWAWAGASVVCGPLQVCDLIEV